MVGVAGFEPTTPSPPVKCATRLRYTPTAGQFPDQEGGIAMKGMEQQAKDAAAPIYSEGTLFRNCDSCALRSCKWARARSRGARSMPLSGWFA